jgi:hypothetical protein
MSLSFDRGLSALLSGADLEWKIDRASPDHRGDEENRGEYAQYYRGGSGQLPGEIENGDYDGEGDPDKPVDCANVFRHGALLSEKSLFSCGFVRCNILKN